MRKNISLFIFFFISLTSLLFPTTTAAAPYGNYLELNGGNVRASSPFTSPPLAFTFEAWIKPGDINGVRTIISIGDSSPRYAVNINGGSLSLSFTHAPNSQTVITAGHLTPNTWQHIAAVISAQSTQLFINGVSVITINNAPSLFPIGDTITLGDGFKGTIDEVRISDSARNVTALWQNGMYNVPLSPDTATLLLWHLDGVRGETTTVDNSGNNISGAFIGSDSQIHYFGVLPPTPTPTSFPIPTLRFRFVLPTISLPPSFLPSSPTPTLSLPQSPTPTPYSFLLPTRSLSPFLRRGM